MTLAKYNEVMERLTLGDAARARILETVQRVDATERRLPGWRRWAVIAAAFAVVLLGALALRPKQPRPSTPETTGLDAQLGFVIEECDGPEALSAAVGFPVEDFRLLPMTFDEIAYTNINNVIAEVSARRGEQTLCYRKSLGEEDNSGLYEDFSQVKTVEALGLPVTLKGTSDGFLLAIWQKDAYICSLALDAPLSEQALCALVSALLGE